MSDIANILSAIDRERAEKFRDLPKELIQRILEIEQKNQELPERAAQLVTKLIEEHIAQSGGGNAQS